MNYMIGLFLMECFQRSYLLYLQVIFLNYCKNIRKQTFSTKEWRGYINYESMRNTNIPRNIGIPTPMGHELLCKTLMKHWTELTEYFREKQKDNQE